MSDATDQYVEQDSADTRMGSPTSQLHSGSSLTKQRKFAKKSTGCQHLTSRHENQVSLEKNSMALGENV